MSPGARPRGSSRIRPAASPRCGVTVPPLFSSSSSRTFLDNQERPAVPTDAMYKRCPAQVGFVFAVPRWSSQYLAALRLPAVVVWPARLATLADRHTLILAVFLFAMRQHASRPALGARGPPNAPPLPPPPPAPRLAGRCCCSFVTLCWQTCHALQHRRTTFGARATVSLKAPRRTPGAFPSQSTLRGHLFIYFHLF